MAVKDKENESKVPSAGPTGPTGAAGAGRRVLIGTNVAFTVIAAAVVVVFLQWAASKGGYVDMTRSSVNSLSEPTERLLKNLEPNVRITSLYFQNPIEEEDQAKYRNAVSDLLALYAATNRSKITTEWINPLEDHAKRRALLQRLEKLPRFKEQIEQHREVVETFTNDLQGQMAKLIDDELAATSGLTAGLGEAGAAGPLAEIQAALDRWRQMLAQRVSAVEEYLTTETPAYSAAVSDIKALYDDFANDLKAIKDFAEKTGRRGKSARAGQDEFLAGVAERYQPLLDRLEEEQKKAQDLPTLQFDEVVGKLAPTANGLLVETDQDAIVVEFMDLWPPIDSNSPRADFKDRAFKGEEKLTRAILRATHKEQTAVVFVRYGGEPFFMGGFMPNQPPAAYAQTKALLEDVNFMVDEWDLKTTLDAPTFDPAPTRTIFVVFKPTPPRDPFGRTDQSPPWGDQHMEALLEAAGEDGRLLFMAGWAPGPFGPIPSSYEFNEYLSGHWGLRVDSGALLLQFVSVGADKYQVRRGAEFMRDVELSDHPIVAGLRPSPMSLPICAPLEVQSPPQGVTVEKLISLPRRDGLFGAKNVQKYQEQLSNEFILKVEGDLEGPFDLAAAATGPKGKVVVISSPNFAEDNVAFAQVFMLGASGLQLRSQNPGNAPLLLNTLHWLNDNTDFLDVGRPIDLDVLTVPGEGTQKAVKAFALVVWPLAAMACGAAVWMIRRR